MTKREAKKQLLGLLLGRLTEDDEALFGPDGEEGSPDHEAFDAARNELVVEFRRRSAGGK